MPKYKLMVSGDCGYSYHVEAIADKFSDLEDQITELDKKMLRWYIADEKGEPTGSMCKIHRNILSTLSYVNECVPQPEKDKLYEAQKETS